MVYMRVLQTIHVYVQLLSEDIPEGIVVLIITFIMLEVSPAAAFIAFDVSIRAVVTRCRSIAAMAVRTCMWFCILSFHSAYPIAC